MKHESLHSISIFSSGKVSKNIELTSQEWEALVLGIFIRQFGQSNCEQSMSTVNYAQKFKKIIRNKLRRMLGDINKKNYYQRIIILRKKINTFHLTKDNQVDKPGELLKQFKNKSIQKAEMLVLLSTLPQRMRNIPDEHLLPIIIWKGQVSLLNCVIKGVKKNFSFINQFEKKYFTVEKIPGWNYNKGKNGTSNSSEYQKLIDWSIILRCVLNLTIQTSPTYFIVGLLNELTTSHDWRPVIELESCIFHFFAPCDANQLDKNKVGITLEALFNSDLSRLVKSVIRDSQTGDFRLPEAFLMNLVEDEKDQHKGLNSYKRCLILGANHLNCQAFTNILEQIYSIILPSSRLVMGNIKLERRDMTGFYSFIKQKSKYAEYQDDVSFQMSCHKWAILYVNDHQSFQIKKSSFGRTQSSENRLLINLKIIPRIKRAPPQETLWFLTTNLGKSCCHCCMRHRNPYYKKLELIEVYTHYQPKIFPLAIYDRSIVVPELLISRSPKPKRLVLISMVLQEYIANEVCQINARKLPPAFTMGKKSMQKNPERSYLQKTPITSILRFRRKLSKYRETKRYDSSEQINLDKMKYHFYDEKDLSSVCFKLYKTNNFSLLHQPLKIKGVWNPKEKLEKLRLEHNLMDGLKVFDNLYATLFEKQLGITCPTNFFSKRNLKHNPRYVLPNFYEKPKIQEKINSFPSMLVFEKIDDLPRSIVRNRMIMSSSREVVKTVGDLQKIASLTQSIFLINRGFHPINTPRFNCLNNNLLDSKSYKDLSEPKQSRYYMDSNVASRSRFSSISNRWRELIKKSSIGESMRGIFIKSGTWRSLISEERSEDNHIESMPKNNQKYEPIKEDWLRKTKINLTDVEKEDKQDIKTKRPETYKNQELSTKSYKPLSRVRFELFPSQIKNPQNSSKENPFKTATIKVSESVSRSNLDELTWDNLKKKLSNEEYMTVRQKMLIFKTPALRETIPLFDIPEDERDLVLATRREQLIQYGKIPFTVRQELERPHNFLEFECLEKSKVPNLIKQKSLGNFHERNSSGHEKYFPEFDHFDIKLSQKPQRHVASKIRASTPIKRRPEKKSTELHAYHDNIEPASVPRIFRLLTNSACSLRSKAKNLVNASPATSNDNFSSNSESRKMIRLKPECLTTPRHKSKSYHKEKLPFSFSFSQSPSSPTNNSKLNYIDHIEKISASWKQEFQNYRKIDGSNNRSTRSLRSLFTSQGQKIISQDRSEEPRNFDRKNKLSKFHHCSHDELRSRARNIEPPRSVSYGSRCQKTKSNHRIRQSRIDLSPELNNKTSMHQNPSSRTLQDCFTNNSMPQFEPIDTESFIAQSAQTNCHNFALNNSQGHLASGSTWKMRPTQIRQPTAIQYSPRTDSLAQGIHHVSRLTPRENTWTAPSPSSWPVEDPSTNHPLFCHQPHHKNVAEGKFKSISAISSMPTKEVAFAFTTHDSFSFDSIAS